MTNERTEILEAMLTRMSAFAGRFERRAGDAEAGARQVEVDYPEGGRLVAGECRDGHVHGQWTLWHPDGGKWQAISFHYGDAHGAWQCWYPGGERWLSVKFFYGKRDGTWLSWWDNGAPMARGEFRQGVRHGLWHFWRPDGAMAREVLYSHGDVLSRSDGASAEAEPARL